MLELPISDRIKRSEVCGIGVRERDPAETLGFFHRVSMKHWAYVGGPKEE